jgi:hypothetical protein
MSSPDDRVSRSWRRFLRFNVGWLIVVVLVIGAGLGWVAREAHIQRDAVAAIKRAGGSVGFHTGCTHFVRGPSLKESPVAQELWAPKWLVDAIGIDYFDRVDSVGFYLNGCTDEAIVHVGRLPGLLFLSVDGGTVTDTGLTHVKGLTNLDELNLRNEQITDAGLADLKGLTKLHRLYLGGSQVTDAGVKELQRALPNTIIRD